MIQMTVSISALKMTASEMKHNSKPDGIRKTVWIVCVLVSVVFHGLWLSAATTLSGTQVSNEAVQVPEPLEGGLDPYKTKTTLAFDDDDQHFLLSRDRRNRWQVDVSVESRVVSFATIFLDGRMTCQFAFLGPERWFGACDVYPIQGTSIVDIAKKQRSYREPLFIDIYFLSSLRKDCPPVLIAKHVRFGGPGGWNQPRFDLAVAQELATWHESERVVLLEAMKNAQGLGARKLQLRVSQLFGEPGGDDATPKTAMLEVETPPFEVRTRLSGDQLRGLESYFGDFVLDIP